MRLRAVIIDDEETGIDMLKFLLDKYVPDVKIVGQALRAQEGIELIENYKPEIVFLDISMPKMDGFELLEKVEWKEFNLVFTTAHQEHGLKALKLNAKDYLLKPIDYHDLIAAVERIKLKVVNVSSPEFDYSLLNQMKLQSAGRIAVNSKDGIEFVDPLDIVSCESSSNYTVISLCDGKSIICPKTLKEFAKLCAGTSNFMRVHHSYIVNLHKIARYQKDEENIIMNNNQKIPLAKSKRELFFQWLAK